MFVALTFQTPISIHAPTRGATSRFRNYWIFSRYFNPRSHEGSDDMIVNFQHHLFNFNPRSHEGSDEQNEFGRTTAEISIHAPTRGATLYYLPVENLDVFQSTLPRGERRTVELELTENLTISIHAPTRGATLLYIAFVFPSLISIHAPTRGATINGVRAWSDANEISIHAPTRGATYLLHQLQQQNQISIHAPTRGATNYTVEEITIPEISIHAPTRGATERPVKLEQ